MPWVRDAQVVPNLRLRSSPGIVPRLRAESSRRARAERLRCHVYRSEADFIPLKMRVCVSPRVSTAPRTPKRNARETQLECSGCLETHENIYILVYQNNSSYRSATSLLATWILQFNNAGIGVFLAKNQEYFFRR